MIKPAIVSNNITVEVFARCGFSITDNEAFSLIELTAPVIANLLS